VVRIVAKQRWSVGIAALGRCFAMMLRGTGLKRDSDRDQDPLVDLLCRRRQPGHGAGFARQPCSGAGCPAALPTTPTPDAAAPAEAGGEIIVTGSRIERPDLTASSPVSVISADTLKSVNTVTVEQLLSVNPQFAAGLNGASNNPGDGSATLDLRGWAPSARWCCSTASACRSMTLRARLTSTRFRQS
jgi:hypothetical protein